MMVSKWGVGWKAPSLEIQSLAGAMYRNPELDPEMPFEEDPGFLKILFSYACIPFF